MPFTYLLAVFLILDCDSFKAESILEARHHRHQGDQDDDRARDIRVQVVLTHVLSLCTLYFLLRPVLVTFEDFNDRENVLRKAGMLRGSNIHVTEDMSR